MFDVGSWDSEELDPIGASADYLWARAKSQDRYVQVPGTIHSNAFLSPTPESFIIISKTSTTTEQCYNMYITNTRNPNMGNSMHSFLDSHQQQNTPDTELQNCSQPSSLTARIPNAPQTSTLLYKVKRTGAQIA